MDLGHLREDYQSAGIDIAGVAADPTAQFERWFSEVQDAGLWEPNAMVVSTINDEGFPASRNVLLKAFDQNGFVFYTNYDSDKGQQLTNNPKTSLTFSWHELRRQVRITGTAAKLSAQESDAYFASRPRGSQLGAWASPQSAVITDRSELDDRWAELESKFDDSVVPRPPHWGGFRVVPIAVEFWQGRPNRMHDRLRYSEITTGDGWTIDRLAP